MRASTPNAFPIEAVLPDIRQALCDGTRLVLEAPPGAGKTTQVPLALCLEPWCKDKKIIVLEPRRVAARAAATFMAQQLGEEPGQTVGYRIRFDNKVSRQTRIEVVTEGILTRMIQDDPMLEGVGAVLFDEFHERHLPGDLGLALTLDIQGALREDLRIVVMSATLDGERLANLLQAQRISSAGRSFPVSVEYFPAQREESLAVQIKRCLERAMAEQAGDALVFLPGQREIGLIASALQQSALGEHQIISLYGDMPVEKQSEALAPASDGSRRIILATNIAESSVTLPGVRIVLDSGLAREPRFDTASGFSRLQTVYISQASADQRTGRAGRVAAGNCYRLWPKEQRLDTSRNPEINTCDLAPLALELAAWGSSDLQFIDPPPTGNLASAQALLLRLGALDQHFAITSAGRKLLSAGTHPRLATMLHNAKTAAEQALACDLAALIDARDPLTHYRGDDWLSRVQALHDFRSKQNSTAHYGTSRATLAALDRTAMQWRKRLGCKATPNTVSAHLIGDILAHAYPDRIARQHADNPLRYQLSNGRMARLSEESRLIGEPWLCVSELRFENRDSLILRAAPLDESRLQQDFPERFCTEELVRWDDKSRALLAVRESRFDQIVLSSKPSGKPDTAQAAQALCDAVADYGLDCLPWTEELQQWRIRVECLRAWLPQLALPELSDKALLDSRESWLLPAFVGLFRLDALSARTLQDALTALCDWPTLQTIEHAAPVKILVPSGLERPILYSADNPPVLAVKLQELFGLAETPRIAQGKIPLTLHLLSPGGKPLQITQDLSSFWERTYPEVKKEMKGRYPKHPWPDDPWSAQATHRTKRFSNPPG